jgi:hypothetical protein
MPLVAVIPQPNAPVELREVPTPELEADSALLEVELSEVCGTDVYLQQGRLPGVPFPLVPGHVSVGRLSKILTSDLVRSAPWAGLKSKLSRYELAQANDALADVSEG